MNPVLIRVEGISKAFRVREKPVPVLHDADGIERFLPRSAVFGYHQVVTIEVGPMELTTIQDIERAIDALPPQELAELYAWMDRHRPQSSAASGTTVFEQGLGLFGGPSDSALMDEVVRIAYGERRRPARPFASL